MALYNDIVMEHFLNPKNVGDMENPDGTGVYGSPVCGDMMQIQIKVENDVITDAKFKTFGCGSAIASSSMATSMIIGKTVEEALEKLDSQSMLTGFVGLRNMYASAAHYTDAQGRTTYAFMYFLNIFPAGLSNEVKNNYGY